MKFGRGSIVYGGSLLLHAGVAFALVRIEPEPLHEATTVTVVEVKKSKQEKKAEPPPPPPEPPVVQPTAPKVKKAAPAPPEPVAEAQPKAAEAPSGNAAPPPMFGLTLSGGVGVGVGGIAVPQGDSLSAPQGPRVTRTAEPKALAPKKDRAGSPSDTECLEALVKPKPIAIPQPAYADRAREAGIQGKVRVELTVDETGAVVQTRVLEGLGYGLDEAALEAARSARFEPALRCGKPTRTTFVIGIRFAL